MLVLPSVVDVAPFRMLLTCTQHHACGILSLANALDRPCKLVVVVGYAARRCGMMLVCDDAAASKADCRLMARQPGRYVRCL